MFLSCMKAKISLSLPQFTSSDLFLFGSVGLSLSLSWTVTLQVCTISILFFVVVKFFCGVEIVVELRESVCNSLS